MTEKKIYLIDAHGFLHRFYHALPKLTTSKGEEVGALYGFTRMILKILREKKPEYFAVCFDSPGKNFRYEIFPDYKSNRKEIEDSLKNQLQVAREIVPALGLNSVSVDGVEADDIMATIANIAQENSFDTIIITTDKDMLQIVNEKIKLWDANSPDLTDNAAVLNKFKVTPQQMVDFLSLVGDSSDNVPGAKGIGPKGAQKLLAEYGSLENILNAADRLFCNPDKISANKLLEKVHNSKKDILLSKQVVMLNKNVPLNIKLSDLIVRGPKNDLLKELAKRLEFKDLFNLVELSAKGKSEPELKPSETAGLSKILNKHEGFVGIVVLEDFIYLTDDMQNSIKKITDLSMKEKNRIFEIFANDKIRKIGHGFKNILHAITSLPIYPLKGESCNSQAGSVVDAPEIKLKNIFDTQIASSLLKAGLSAEREAKRSDITRLTLEGIVFKPEEAGLTLSELAQKLDAELSINELKRVYEEIELPLIEVIYSMEKTGIKIDIEHLKKLDLEFKNKLSVLQHEIETMTGTEINLNSPKQLSFLLFQKLNLQIEPAKKHKFKTQNGFSTSTDVLWSLLNVHPVIAKILEYREISKLKSSFVVPLLEMADSNHRVHTNFESLGTSTGRFSSSKPNLQNIPIRTKHGQEIRKAFVSCDGYVLVSADYSQIDLRVLAHVSKDKCLIDSFMRNEDIHLKTAAEVFKKHISQVDDEMRQRAKAINFGIVYGQTPAGLAQELNISKTEAKQYIEHYFNIYSGVRDWIESNLRYAREKGYVTTFTGRKRYFPQINSNNAHIRSFAERAAINMPIQGGSADIIKKAMINIYRRISREAVKCRMLLQVHDELLFETVPENVEKICGIIKHEMENSLKLSVPLKVDIKIGKNWQEMTNIY